MHRQFYNILDVNYIFKKLLNFLISNEKGNLIYLKENVLLRICRPHSGK